MTVIPLRPERFRLIRGTLPPGKWCSHLGEQIYVDGHSRVVWCEKCEAHLDPIAVLADIANDGSWVLHMRKEKARLAEQIEALKQEQAALKKSVDGLKRRRGKP